jgi:uncharacterized protein (DUF58 family)
MFEHIKSKPLYQKTVHPMKWFMSRLPADPKHIKLDRKRIYIIPSQLGYIFALILIVLLLASMNYGASLGFMLTFLLASLVVVIMLHTFRNLCNLHIEITQANNVFVGENSLFPITLSSQDNSHFYSLFIQCQSFLSEANNLLPNTKTKVKIALLAEKRGEIKAPQFRLYSTFPFGIFYSWTLVTPSCSSWVYPKPSNKAIPLPESQESNNTEQIGTKLGRGSDDFHGMRSYQKGDSYKNIAWKSYAKGQALQSKEFVSEITSDLWLDENHLHFSSIEDKLSQLCQWVLDAHQQGLSYGLNLKTITIAPDKGSAHRTKCLEALARYPHA